MIKVAILYSLQTSKFNIRNSTFRLLHLESEFEVRMLNVELRSLK
jgi:hypothetical protein